MNKQFDLELHHKLISTIFGLCLADRVGPILVDRELLCEVHDVLVADKEMLRENHDPA